MRKFYVLSLLFFCGLSVHAQLVSNYGFTQTSGTFTPITGGTQVVKATGATGNPGLDDVNYTLATGTIPFTFTFNGTGYTGLTINTNGYLTFGATTPTTNSYVPISATTGYAGAISPLGVDMRGIFSTTGTTTSASTTLTAVVNTVGISLGDVIIGTGIPAGTTVTAKTANTITLSAAATASGTAITFTVYSGEIQYQTIGTAPNRTFVIQWLNFQEYNQANSALTYQVRLNEGGGVATAQTIDIIYGSSVTGSTSISPQVGLRGATNADFNNRTSTTTWSATTAGTANTNSITLSATVFPASGQQYSFAPPLPCTTPSAPGTLTLTPAGLTTINGSFVAAGGPPTGYLVVRYPTASAVTAPVTGTTYVIGGTLGAGTIVQVSGATTFSATGLNPGTTYDFYVYAYNSAGCSGGPIYSTTASNATASTTACSMTGTYPIGPGQTYTTLTAAFAALAVNGTAGPVVLELLPAYVSTGETFPITVGNIPCISSTNNVTVRPQAAATNLTITSANTTATIDLNGASFINFDGRAGGTGATQLTIANTSTATGGTAVRFINDANNNSIRYTNLTALYASTSSGVINFSTTTGANGNDNNTIDNCSIDGGAGTTASPTLVALNGIYSAGSTSTTATNNSGNIISNNKIFNFFGAATASAGISLQSGNTDWTITGNSLYQTSARTTTSAVTIYGLNISNTSGNNFTITNNFIGGSSASAAGSAWTIGGTVANRFRAISIAVGTTTASSVQGNTIANFNFSSSSAATTVGGPWCGIYVNGGSINIGTVTANTIGNAATGSIVSTITTTGGISSGIFVDAGTTLAISNNTIGSVNALGSGTGISHGFTGINIAAGTTVTVNNNTIGNATVANSINAGTASTNASTQSVIGISNTSTGTIAITNNLIANLTNAYVPTVNTSRVMAGIVSTSGINTITGNTVRNLSTGALTTGTIASVAGILLSSGTTGAQTVSQNVIHSLSNNNASAAVIVTGLSYAYSGSTTTGNIVARNFIHSLNVSNATAIINGMQVTLGTTTYQNNMVRLGIDAAGASITAGAQINGIAETAGTDNFYFNSIYIGGTGVVSSANTYAFNSTVTTNTRILQNNIFSNVRSNASGTGKNYAVRVGGAAANPTGLTINYNVYFANGTGGVFGFFNSADVATLAAWQTAVGQDANSFNSDPQFLTPAGTSSTVDLHINPSVTTVVEGNGLAIAAITDDYDGQARSGLTPTDIGADAGLFTGNDLTPPTITYTTLGSTCSLSNITLSGVTITDLSGVPTTGTLVPRIYFRKGTGSWFSQPGTLTSGTGTNGTWSFTIDNALLGGVVAGNTISYYVIAQDISAATNITSSPSAGLVATNVNTVTTHPTSPNTYTISATLSGAYNVGAGQTFTTLTGAIAAYNTSCISGPVVFNLTDATYSTAETFPLIINANASANATNTLTIKPTATATITGSVTSGALIKLNGADYVIIDGSNNGTTSQNLTINNTATTSPTAVALSSLGLGAGATNDVIKNTIITTASNTASSYGIAIGGATPGNTGDDNDNVTLQNNSINTVYYGIYVGGTTAVSAGAADGLIIAGNSIGSATLANYVLFRGINLLGAVSPSVTGNTIFNLKTSSLSANIAGIDVGTNVVNGTIGQNNINGIYQSNTSGYGAYGINFSSTTGTTGVTIVNNIIYDIQTANYSTSSTQYNAFGIRLTGGTNLKLYHNSVNLFGAISAGSSGGMSADLIITSSSVTGLDIRNNVFKNTMTFGVSGSLTYSVYSVTGLTFGTINNNDYYGVSGTNTTYNVGYSGSASLANLLAWQGYTGQDLNSISADPLFATNTLLVPGAGSPLLSAGSTGTGVTVDYLGTLRGTPPTIGAYEMASDLTPPTIVYTPLPVSCATGARTLTATITDVSGVPTSGIGLPVAYYKINAGVYIAVQGVSIGSNQYTFNIGTGSVANDVVSYYIVAQDNVSTPNVGVSPSAGASGLTANPPAAGTPPTTPSSYTIGVTLNGTYTVGSGGNFTTLTAAVNAYNNGCITGPVVFSLTDANYSTAETFPIIINANPAASSTNTLTIRPAAGVTALITGTSTSSIIKLNGADYVIINGSNNGTSTRNLTITNSSSSSSAAVIWGASASSSDAVTNTTVQNSILSGNSSTTTGYGIAYGGTTIAANAIAPNSNNSFLNNQISTVQIAINILGTSGANLDINNTVAFNNLGTSTLALGLFGLQTIYQNGITVNQNDIQNIVSSGSTNLKGIALIETKNATVTRNAVHKIVYNGTSTTKIFAINTSSGTNFATSGNPSANSFINNTVFDITSTCTSTTWNTSGINDDGGYGDKFYFNTVYLNATTVSSGTSGGYPVAAFSNGNASIVTTASALDIRNNIFTITGAATSTSATFYANYNYATNYTGSTLDYNDLYVAVTSGIGYTGYYNFTSYPTLAAWRTITTQEANSIETNPLLTSPTNVIPNLGSTVFGAGTPIAGVTVDFTGATRSTIAPSIGAYENGADLSGPTISYTPLSTTCTTGNRTLTATITDISGVPTSGTGLPVLYFKINSGAYTAVQGVYAGSNQYTFSFGAGTVTGDIVSYYIVAQDNVSTPNVSVFPSAGAAGLTPNPPAAGTPPTSPSTYLTGTSLGGTYTVGAGGNFTTLTAAVNAYNTACLSGPVVFSLISSTYTAGETFPITINPNGFANSTNTLTIRPASGVTATITGSVTSGALIKLNGADYVIIDGSNNGTTSQNLTINNTATTSPTAVALSSLGLGAGATNDVIKNTIITTASNTASSYGIAIGGATPGNTGDDNDNVTLQNNSINTVYYGIYVGGTTAVSAGAADGLIIAGNSIGSATLANYVLFRGITLSGAVSPSVTGNTIFNLKTSSLSANIAGIDVGTNVVNGTIGQNNINGIYQSNTSGYGAYGINFSSTTGTTGVSIVNNIIYDIQTANYSTTSTQYNAFGIRLTGGTNLKLYHNSVNLFGAISAGSSGGMSADLIITSSSVTGLDIRNNVFKNTMTFGVSGSLTYSVYSVTGLTFGTINNNDYYGVSGTNTTYNVGYSGSASLANLLAWQGYTGQDLNSISADPLFASNTILSPNSGSPLVSAGATGTGVTIDFNGVTRGTPPTIGAYETTVDLIGPSITYTPFGISCVAGARTLTATITDFSGVPISGTGLPVAYYKINAGAYIAVQGVSIGSNQYTFNIGTGSVANDVVSYYVVAQDNVATPNVSVFPATGAAGFSSNPPAVSTPPTSPSQYTVGTALNGTYTVGSGGNYTTLTAAVAAYNTACLNGPVVFSLTDANYSTAETFPIVINANPAASSTNTLTIVPATGITANITGSSTSAIIKLNGADYVTIDGSNNGTATRNLTIANTNTGTSSSIIWLASVASPVDGANNNTVKNVTVTGNAPATTSAGIISSGSSFGAVAEAQNSNNRYQNNLITSASGGIVLIGTTGNETANIITGNTIGSVTSTSKIGQNGIYITQQQNVTISNNNIFGVSSSTNILTAGLYVGGTISGGTISGNKISDIKNTTARQAYGIELISTSTAANLTLVNNMIFDVSCLGTNTALNRSGHGIAIITGGGYNLYFNTVNLNTDQGTGATSASNAALYVALGVVALDVRDNIFVNSQANGNRYAIYSDAVNTAFTSIDYNDYVSSGAALGYIGSARTTLSDIVAGFGGNTNSISVAPIFVSANDMHLVAASNPGLNDLGTMITGITTDIDGDVRPASGSTNPDMGADEFKPAIDDAGITGISITTLCAGPQVVQVILKNYAVTTLTAVTINWTVNGVPQTPYSWTGSLASNASVTVPLSPAYTFVAGVPYIITATTSQPNGNTDSNTGNDTYTSGTLQTGLSGTYVIGATGADFTTLTAAVAAANSYGLCGPTVFSLKDATYPSETFPIVINSLGGSSAINTLTIRPATSVSPVISGSSVSAIIKLNAADNIIIDGSNNGTASRNLTIANTSTSTTSNVVWLASIATPADGANNNIIKNTIITGNAPATTYGGIMSTGAIVTAIADAANSNNTYQNNLITAANVGIAIVGPTGNETGNSIINNTIGSATAASKIGLNGIFVAQEQNMVISGNTITGVSSATNVLTAGIYVGGTIANGSITNNKVSDIKNTTARQSYGIELNSTSTSSGLTVANNMVFDVSCLGTSSTLNRSGHGIALIAGGGYKIYYNTVNLNTDQGSGATSANNAALYVASAVTDIDVRDNIFVNSQTYGTRYAIYSDAANSVFSSIDYNDYASSGTALGYIGSARITLADIVTGFGGNSNSQNITPVFVSATDMHLNPGANIALNDLGVEITGITTDIDGEVRPATGSTNPDMGADEYTPPPCTGAIGGTIVISGPVVFCQSGSATITASGYSGGIGATYQWQYSTDNFAADINNLSGQTNPASATTGVINANTYYRLKVTCASASATAYSNTVLITVNNPQITGTTPATRCGTGTVTLNATGSAGTTTVWYAAATGGTALATGTSFTTPSITATTNYYVSAANGPATVNGGRLAPASTSTYNDGTTGLVFTVTNQFTLNSVDVYNNGSAGTMTIQLVNNAGTVLQTSTSFNLPAATGTTPFVATLGWSIPTGTGYRLMASSGTASLVRESGLGGFPYALGTVGSITGGYFGSTSTSYYHFYNWNIATVCESSRSQVTATVTTPPAITLDKTTDAICAGTTSVVNVTGTVSNYDTYTWSGGPLTASGTPSGSTVTLSPIVSTVYTLSASQSSGSFCANTSTVSITVNPAPSDIAVSPAATSICTGTVQPLTTTGGITTGQAFVETANVLPTTFTVTNTSGTGTATLNTTYYSEGTGSVLFNTASLSADVQYAMNSNINLTGATSAQLTFAHIASMEGPSTTYDAGYVEYSVNGGTSWTLFPTSSYAGAGTLITSVNSVTVSGVVFSTKSYPEWVSQFTSSSATFGTGPGTTLWKNETINIPAAALSSSQFRVRFRYMNDDLINYNGWLLDNIRIVKTAQNVTWTPITGLYTNAAATIPYTAGTNAPTVYAAPIATTTYTAKSTAGTCEKNTPVVITVKAAGTWAGINTNWFDASNWCSGVPTATSDIIIPAGVANYPVILTGTTALAHNVTIATGGGIVTINTGGTLNATGNIANSGTLTNNGSIKFSGSALQTFPGSGTIDAMSSIEIANTGAGVQLNNPVSITKELKPTSGKLDLANYDVTIKSSATATASVSAIAPGFTFNYGTGRFVIERFINTGTLSSTVHGKSWQFLATPLQDSTLDATGTTIRQSWQEGAVNTNSTGYGTYITDPNYNGVNGFDATSAGPSIKTYISAVPDGFASLPPASGTNMKISNKKGYMLYVRGDRSVIGSATPTAPTNLRIAGKIYDNAALPLSTTIAAVNRFESIGNPYASAIDFKKVYLGATNIDNTFYVWDPSLTGSNTFGLGGYQTIAGVTGYLATPGGGKIYNEPARKYDTLQSGQAFYVKSSATGNATIAFNENMKVSGSALVNRTVTDDPSTIPMLSTMLYTNTGSLADGNRVVFDNDYSNEVDGDDAPKFVNGSENFGLTRNERSLSVEAHARIVAFDTVYYKMSGMQQQDYRLLFAPQNLISTGLQAELIDQYLNTRTPVSLSDSNYVTVNINADVASKAADRFKLVFTPLSGPLPVTITSISANRNQDRSIVVHWTVENELNIERYVVERSANGSDFTGIITTGASNARVYLENDLSPLSADNYYRIRAISIGGQIQYSAIVKVGPIKDEGKISVNPNPAINKTVQVQFTNEPKGTYKLMLTNKLSQVVYNGTAAVNGSGFVKTINLHPSTTSGTYQLKITGEDGTVKVIQVVIE